LSFSLEEQSLYLSRTKPTKKGTKNQGQKKQAVGIFSCEGILEQFERNHCCAKEKKSKLQISLPHHFFWIKSDSKKYSIFFHWLLYEEILFFGKKVGGAKSFSREKYYFFAKKV